MKDRLLYIVDIEFDNPGESLTGIRRYRKSIESWLDDKVYEGITEAFVGATGLTPMIRSSHTVIVQPFDRVPAIEAIAELLRKHEDKNETESRAMAAKILIKSEEDWG